MIVIGLLLLFNIAEAAFTLAVLVSFALFMAGVDELVEAPRHEVRWPSYVLAVIWIVTGVVAIVWPGRDAVGAGRDGRHRSDHRRHRPGGVRGTHAPRPAGVGAVARRRRTHDARRAIVCLIWPGATVLALAVLLGLWVVMRGIVTTMFALGLRRLQGTMSPAVPT